MSWRGRAGGLLALLLAAFVSVPLAPGRETAEVAPIVHPIATSAHLDPRPVGDLRPAGERAPAWPGSAIPVATGPAAIAGPPVVRWWTPVASVADRFATTHVLAIRGRAPPPSGART